MNNQIPSIFSTLQNTQNLERSARQGTEAINEIEDANVANSSRDFQRFIRSSNERLIPSNSSDHRNEISPNLYMATFLDNAFEDDIFEMNEEPNNSNLNSRNHLQTPRFQSEQFS